MLQKGVGTKWDTCSLSTNLVILIENYIFYPIKNSRFCIVFTHSTYTLYSLLKVIFSLFSPPSTSTTTLNNIRRT